MPRYKEKSKDVARYKNVKYDSLCRVATRQEDSLPCRVTIKKKTTAYSE
jgi:hypothetical protein